MTEDVLFSDSWHRVASQRPRLRPDVKVHRQAFRGELWRVLGDPLRNDWFRVRDAAWRFLVRLDGRSTVEAAWRRQLEIDPVHTPGQQEVVQLLAQLHGAGLLSGELSADGTATFQRLQQRRRREVTAKWTNFLFVRIPLYDPQRLLAAAGPLIRLIFNRWMGMLWLAVLVVGMVAVFGQSERFFAQTQGVLAPGNLLWLYGSWAILKLLHEFAHGAAVQRSGGEVHVMGLMLLVFTPVPYVDASAAWGFRERRARLLVGGAGMMSDLAVAAVAALVWANTGDGLVNALAHNLVLLGSVATLGFNGNPLLRFDAYYLLSDLLDQPNLATRAQQQMISTAERRLWGRREAKPVGRTARECFWLNAYGVASLVYRILLMTVIVLFVSEQFFGLGLLLAAGALVLWGFVPLVKFGRYLAGSTRLARCRSRAVGVTVALVAALVLIVGVVPMPHHFRAPGAVRARDAANVVASTEGTVIRVTVEPGSRVEAGQVLVELANPELDARERQLRAMLDEVESRLRLARSQAPAQLAPLRARADFLEQQQAELTARREALQVRAPHAGWFLAPYAESYPGVWVARGTEVGSVIGDESVYFSTVVAQSEAAELFDGELRSGEVWLPGWDQSPLPAGVPEIVPVDRSRLPAASLGWLAGGVVRVAEDERGTTTTEPFYEVRLPLAGGPALRHLRSGTARFGLDPQPWAVQGWRAFRQLLQRKYQL